MAKLEEEKISSRPVFAGRLLKVRVDTVRLPNGIESTREVVEHPGAVAVIALTPERELILVRQYRQAVGEVMLEVPAGVPLAGEAGAAAARRELEEETGWRARSVKKLFEGYASPGYSDEVVRFFLAEELTLFQQKTDEDELIEAVELPLGEARALLKAGKIKDNKTMLAILAADLYLKGELA
jgi:ADP-ribose pyrophosphatase